MDGATVSIPECLKNLFVHICDMIKGKESDVADIAFEKLAKKVSKFFCFVFELPESGFIISKLKIFDM